MLQLTVQNGALTRSSSGESGNILDSSGCRRKTGRPKKTWRRTFQQDLQMVDFKWEEVEYVATDRSKWRQAAARCAQRHGKN